MTTRRQFMKAVAGGAAAALAAGNGRAAAQERPNILWIYADDHSHNAISAYGSHLKDVAPTPNIDRLAKEGMLFRNSFVTNSICGPCRAVVLTGKHSHLNGFRQNGDRFNGNQQTFAKLVQNAGYQTAVYGKWHLGTDPVGFDDWTVLPGQGHYYNPDFLTPAGRVTEEGYVSDLITDKALDWLDNKRDADKPFLLMLQHKAPHREWEPGPEQLTTFDDVEIPEPPTLFDNYENRGSAARQQDMSIEKTMRLAEDNKVWELLSEEERENNGAWRRTYGRMTTAQRKLWESAYAPKNKAFLEAKPEGKDLVRWKYQRYMKDYLRCIRSVDDNVGRVLDYLGDHGLDKNTVVFYSSDQSFYLGEHGWFDKRFIYEESLRTPLLARWPGVIDAGVENTELVQNLDTAETFLDLAGAPIPADMQGRSLVPLMKGATPSDWRDAIYYHYYEGEGKVHNVYKHYGVRTARYKLVYYYTLDEWEFFDLERDPLELKSEYDNPEYAGRIAEHKRRLDELRVQYDCPEDPDALAV